LVPLDLTFGGAVDFLEPNWWKVEVTDGVEMHASLGVFFPNVGNCLLMKGDDCPSAVSFHGFSSAPSCFTWTPDYTGHVWFFILGLADGKTEYSLRFGLGPCP